MKICSKCGETRSKGDFHKDRTKKDGLYSSCKECVSKQDALTYEKHAEKRKATARRYFRRNREKYNIYKPYNPDYYSSEISRRKKRARDIRRRALQKNADIEHKITHETIEILFEHHKGKCAYCGIEVGDNYHIDHRTPLSRGGGNELKNLALSCPSCNHRKGTMTDVEFAG